MLHFIMDRNLLLYAVSVSCAVGVISQIILRQLYQRLIRDTKNTGEPASRFLMQLRQRFQYCSHLNEKVGNVQALIQKSVMEYRFWGMSLHQWKRMGLQCFVFSLLCVSGGTMATVMAGGELITGNVYLWMGALAAALTAAAYGIADTGYSRDCLEVRLADYLENSGAVRDYAEDAQYESEFHSREAMQGYGQERSRETMQEYGQERSRETMQGYGQERSREAMQGYGQEHGRETMQEHGREGMQEYDTEQEDYGTSAIVSVAEGRKSKRRARAEAAAAESRAQKEKRELKENLARMKSGAQAGIQETAAASERERSRERGADILRQMDPKEQERILKEVLKEFLS